MKLLTITAAIVLTASLAFAGPLEEKQARLDIIQMEMNMVIRAKYDIITICDKRIKELQIEGIRLNAEIQKIVDAKKAAAVEALEQGKPKEAGK